MSRHPLRPRASGRRVILSCLTRAGLTFFRVSFQPKDCLSTHLITSLFQINMDEEAETYKLWRIRKTVMQVR